MSGLTERLICEVCGKEGDDVLEVPGVWGAWGHNAFDFNWEREAAPAVLCADCEQENYRYCGGCGDLIPRDHYGTGYPEDYEGETLCPTCAVKEGLVVGCPIIDLRPTPPTPEEP